MRQRPRLRERRVHRQDVRHAGPNGGAERGAKRGAKCVAERGADSSAEREPIVFSNNVDLGQSERLSLRGAFVEPLAESQRLAERVTIRISVEIAE